MNQAENPIIKNIGNIIGVAVLLCIFVFMLSHPRRENEYDMRYVEILVTQKEITEMDDVAVYLIHTEDPDKNQEIFEITNAALGERFEESEVYKQIKPGKYYKLRIAEPEAYESHYPSICGAVTLIDGFTPDAKTIGDR